MPIDVKVFGEELWVGAHKIGAKPDKLSYTTWDELIEFFRGTDAEEASVDAEKARAESYEKGYAEGLKRGRKNGMAEGLAR